MRTIKNVINLFFLLLGHLFPRSKRKIVFGAWNGNSYSDNPKFLFQYFFSHPEWQIVWIGNKQVRATLPTLPSHASFAVRHSFIGMWHALTAGTWVFSHSPNDISIVAVWGHTLLIDTSHGVALKNVGEACPGFRRQKELFSKFWRKIFSNRIFLVVPSRLQGQNTLASYPGMFQEHILTFGMPASDYIKKNARNFSLISSLRDKFSAEFGIPIDRKWIIYAPTFRLTRIRNFSFSDMSEPDRTEVFQALAKQNAIIVEKLHPCVIANTSHLSDNCFIYQIGGKSGQNIEPYELWLAADAIISDYSGSVVPFFFQGKPVIHFSYDYEYYKRNDSGLIDDLDNIRFGLIARNIREVCQIIKNLDSATNKCGQLAESLIECEDGHSCERYERFICERVGIKSVRHHIQS